ncbi:hypothetical protein D3C80_1079770 [compost metagenome]
MGFLAVTMVGDRSHDQDEHQHGRNRLQGADKHFAKKGQVAGDGRCQQGEGDAGEQANDDLSHQAGAVEDAEERGHVQRYLGIWKGRTLP